MKFLIDIEKENYEALKECFPKLRELDDIELEERLSEIFNEILRAEL